MLLNFRNFSIYLLRKLRVIKIAFGSIFTTAIFIATLRFMIINLLHLDFDLWLELGELCQALRQY